MRFIAAAIIAVLAAAPVACSERSEDHVDHATRTDACAPASRSSCGSGAVNAGGDQDSPPPSCGGAAPDFDKGGSTIVSGEKSVRVPFELLNEHIVIPVSVNGSDPFKLVLDTGMPFYGASIAPGPRADALELENPDGLQVMVAGNEGVEPRVGTGATLTIPGVEFTDQVVMVIPLPGCEDTGAVVESEGVIGLTVFDNYVVEVDYDERVLTLTEPDAFEYAGAGAEVPIRLGPVRMPEVNLALASESGDDIPIGMVVDTGASLAMSITLGTNGALVLPSGARDLVVGYSAWGEVRGKLGRVDFLRLGDFELDDMLVTYFEAGAPGVPPCGENGLLGSEVLQRFTVTFDYARERMYLEPGERFDEPFVFSMTGLAYRRADDGSLEVVRVFPDSPASEGGLAEGDVILSLNGVPSGDYGDDAIRRIMRTEESKLTLELATSEGPREVTLTPRRLI